MESLYLRMKKLKHALDIFRLIYLSRIGSEKKKEKKKRIEPILKKFNKPYAWWNESGERVRFLG